MGSRISLAWLNPSRTSSATTKYASLIGAVTLTKWYRATENRLPPFWRIRVAGASTFEGCSGVRTVTSSGSIRNKIDASPMT
jgi:hypothetical protein